MSRAALRVLTHFPAAGLASLAERVPGIELIDVPQEGEIAPGVEGEILLTWAWGSPNLPEIVERGVQWIHTIGTGIDRFPVDAVGDRILTCARGATSAPIAEWTLACMLAFEKDLPARWISEPPEQWNAAQLGTLEGRTLGLVGLGTIGEAVAERALPFGMRVRAVRRSQRPSRIAWVELAASLTDLLETADHLVIATAATAETRHLIGKEALASVKPGVHLVNVARGTLIDQDALRIALDDGRVAMASLDVCDPEPLPAGHWLYHHERVRLSSHVSWAAPDSVERILSTFGANLERYLAGEPLEGRVDLLRGY
jgi:phosphoglycerate dehydrogenase-like enzyme